MNWITSLLALISVFLVGTGKVFVSFYGTNLKPVIDPYWFVNRKTMDSYVSKHRAREVKVLHVINDSVLTVCVCVCVSVCVCVCVLLSIYNFTLSTSNSWLKACLCITIKTSCIIRWLVITATSPPWRANTQMPQRVWVVQRHRARFD